MDPTLYDEFVRCLKSGHGDDFDVEMLHRYADLNNKIRVCVKNYKSENGVSTRFFKGIGDDN